MARPSPETEQTIQDALNQIAAGRITQPGDDVGKAYNIGCDRAIKILEDYINGIGLFQLHVRRTSKRRKDGPHAAL